MCVCMSIIPGMGVGQAIHAWCVWVGVEGRVQGKHINTPGVFLPLITLAKKPRGEGPVKGEQRAENTSPSPKGSHRRAGPTSIQGRRGSRGPNKNEPGEPYGPPPNSGGGWAPRANFLKYREKNLKKSRRGRAQALTPEKGGPQFGTKGP